MKTEGLIQIRGAQTHKSSTVTQSFVQSYVHTFSKCKCQQQLTLGSTNISHSSPRERELYWMPSLNNRTTTDHCQPHTVQLTLHKQACSMKTIAQIYTCEILTTFMQDSTTVNLTAFIAQVNALNTRGRHPNDTE